MVRTIAQNKQLHQLVTQLNINQETKEELVYSYTKGRETSTAKMERMECQALINNLRVKANASKISDKANIMRRKVLSICHEMKWTVNGKVDFLRLNEYLNKYGYLHKLLNLYTEQELPTLITQFEQLLKHYYGQRKG
jgi:hypothetical protein